ncbi:MAG: transglutaminase domain-containing protein, partial [Flavisolibacter sp.]
KEGCIIEYEYKVKSDFIWNLDPWFFQGNSPVLWSEFQLRVPQFFTYAFLSHGYQPMYINQKKESQGHFIISNTKTSPGSTKNNFISAVTDYRWVMKDVSKLRPEKFTSALKNHIASIEFQLATRNHPLEFYDYRSTWAALTKSLMEVENFGLALQKDNNGLGTELKPLLSGAKNDLEKANSIYKHVRDRYTCNNHSALYLNQSLRNLTKNKTGNVSEINMLLTAMLRFARLDAAPVLLSTTDHGYAIQTYPMITSFNYVISKLSLNGKEYFLDASHSMLGFGKLLPDCYNGHARVVNEEATALNFSADSLIEKKSTILFISNDKNGNWIGKFEQTPGYFESYELREKIMHNQSGKDELLQEEESEFGIDVVIDSVSIDSLNNYDTPLRLQYEMSLSPGTKDHLYINPLFSEVLHENPFTSTQRLYPVEMPFTTDETYMLTMEVPQGYEIESLPEQMIAKMDEEGSAYFEYRISHSNNIISLRTIMKISRTLFMPGEYSTLREFFKIVVDKQKERVVLRKKE